MLLPSLLFSQLQAGGKDDSAQGVGTNVDKVHEAVELSKEYLSQYL
jgi:dihydroxyacetone kinase DhaKLM complex PTS-EIIA-like component DhaM